MTDFTANWEMPKPELGEPPNGPLQVGDLADFLDGDNPHGRVALGRMGVLADRPVSTPANPGKVGRRYLVQGDPDPTENGKEYLDIGVAWVALRGDVPDDSITNAKLAPNSVGPTELQDDSVGPSEIQTDAVGSNEIAAGAVAAAEVAGSLKPSVAAANGAEALRAIGSGAGQVTAGNDSRLTQGAAGVESVRKIGAGATDVVAGNDARLTDQRVPTDGSVSWAKTGAGDNGLGRGSFAAYRNAARTLANAAYTTLLCEVELFDISNWYDTATGRFTPQIAGWYRAGGWFSTDKLGLVQGDYAQFVVRKNGTTRSVILWQDEQYESVPAGWYGLKGTGQGRVFCNGSTDYLTWDIFLNRPAGGINLTVGGPEYTVVYADLVART